MVLVSDVLELGKYENSKTKISPDYRTGFKFHAQPQTGAHSCYKQCP